jgi:DNA-binding transcriptional regulator YhcF (GntR family)
MLVEIDESSPIPLYLQIASSVRRTIAEGRVTAGTRLPATRDLAIELDVNVHTVQRAYGELRDEGLLQLRQGRGAIVTDGEVRGRARLHDLSRALLAEAREQGLSMHELRELMEGMT